MVPSCENNRETRTASTPLSEAFDSDRACLLLTIALAAFILLPTFGFGLGFDHGVLHYVAWTALQGWWPYQDSWDTSFPGILLMHLPAVMWGGGSPLSLRAIDFVVQLVTAGLMFEVGRRMGGARAGLMAALFYAVAYVASGYYDTAQRDGVIVTLLLVALLALWNEPVAPWRFFTAAFALGFACLIRPTYGLVAGAALLLVLIRTQRASSWPRAVRQAFAFGAVVALPMLVFLAVFAAAGRLPALRETMEYLATVYTDLDRKTPAHVLLKMFLDTPQLLWAGMLLSIFALGDTTRRAKVLWVAALFGLCVGIRLIESKTYRYQFWPALASAALLAGVGWNFLLEALAQRATWAGRRTTLVLAVAIAAVIPLLTTRPILAAYRDLVPNVRAELSSSPAYELLNAGSAEQAEVSRYLHDHTQPRDRLLLWGPGAMVYYAAQRVAASRFFVSTAFLCVDEDGDPTNLKMATDCRRPESEGRLQRQFLRELLADIDSQRPHYIVAVNEPDSLEVWEGECFAPDFPELRSVLARDYRLETTIGRWAVHRRNDTAKVATR